MATQILSRSLLWKPPISTKTLITSLLTRTFSSSSSSATFAVVSFRRPLFLRSLSSAIFSPSVLTTSLRAYSTRRTASSLNDPNPNWSNRPPKETILLDGCDFEHWLIVMEKPEGDPTRDEIIDSYIKTLAMVVGSEEEARMKIYSVSTKHYFAFGALVSEEVSYKIKELPRVRWVLPDSYLDVRNKDYGGEPFINGEAVPYDPKYHEEWVRNNARAQERNRRNDRPRANDRSRNFNRRRENMQNQDFQYSPPSPMPNQGMPNSASNMGGPPHGNMGGPTQGNMGGLPQGNFGAGGQPSFPASNAGGFPQGNVGGPLQGNMGGPPRGNMGGPPQGNLGAGSQPSFPASNAGGFPQSNMGGPTQGNLGAGGQSSFPASNAGGFPQSNMGGPTQGNLGAGGQPSFPASNAGGFPQNKGPSPSYSSYDSSGMQQNNYRGPGVPPLHNNSGSGFQPNLAQPPSTAGWSNNTPGANMQNNYPNSPNSGAMPYQGPPQNYQTGPSSGGIPNQGPPQNYQNGYIPSRD